MGSQNECEEAADLITLSGCERITKWRVPKNLTKCPVFRCNNKFKTRSLTITHYKKFHAAHSILCPICNKPIRAKSKWNFIIHYNRCHPDEEVPYDLHTSEEQEMRPVIQAKEVRTLQYNLSFTYFLKNVNILIGSYNLAENQQYFARK